MATARNQPTYDFLAADAPSPQRQPLRETFKQSTAARADINNEQLRAQINTLQYELDAVKQERELTALHHQSEIRDVQTRAEADFKRASAAENASNTVTKKCEALARDFQEAQDRAANEKLQFERKIRSLQEDNRSLREEVEDAQTELASQERGSKHAYTELEARYDTLKASVDGLNEDLDSKVTALQTTQQRLSQRETETGELENEILRLKAQTGDSDTLAVIKKELSEQVAYIKKLEATNREHIAELKQFRKTHKSVEIVEEEKRVLESKVRMMDDLRRELSETQLQRRILEDEKKSWTSYLEGQAAGQEELKYETPEEMARAFIQERLERLSLVDKIGSMQPEMSVKDENIRALEDDKIKLRAELEQAKTSGAGAGDSKLRARLERQKNLAVKEVEYLRAQIKDFEAEEAEFQPDQVDQLRQGRFHELEAMVDQYRTEVQTLNADLSKLEAHPVIQLGAKRPREDDQDDEERLGSLRRKARTLQEDLSQLQSRNQLLEAELKASVSQLASLKESSRTRVLELRQNPTAEAEAIKLSTLSILRDENKALLDQLQGRPASTKVVPISTLDNVRLQMQDLEDKLANAEKKTLRLKQIWSSKSLEFREAVASILGWKLDFMPNGRVKATSILYPTLLNNGEEEENSIIFDGENGTMKVSGGPQSLFAGEIRGLIEFWVEGRKEVPCFLAACTLEFYDKTTRAARM